MSLLSIHTDDRYKPPRYIVEYAIKLARRYNDNNGWYIWIDTNKEQVDVVTPSGPLHSYPFEYIQELN